MEHPNEEAKWKRIRANKKSCLTRICNRAENLIAVRGSRTILQQLLGEIDHALDTLTESNECYVSTLTNDDEKTKAAEYISQIEEQRESIVRRITAYLQERSDEASSEASTVPSHRSAASVARSQETIIESRLTALKRRQEEKRLHQEKEFELKIQRARDQAELAELEAELRQQAFDSGDINADRVADFADEFVAHGEDQRERSSIVPSAAPSRGGDGVTRCPPLRQPPETETGGTRTADWIEQLANGAGVCPAQQRGAALQHNGLHSVPRITLPKFAGDPLEWPKWIGLFEALIHNQTGLSDAEKMVHLQSSVTGLAQQTIEGMLYDAKLYPKALQALQTRFGRSEDVVFANLGAVFQSHPVKHMDTAALEKYHARLHCAVTTLESLGYRGDITSRENLRRAVAKLPLQLRHDWGKRVVELEPSQATLLDLDDWLALQIRIALSSAVTEPEAGKTVSSSEDSRRRQPTAQRSSNARSALATAARERSSQPPCSLCNRQHSLARCDQFTQMTVSQRAQLIADSGRCFRCLETGHISKKCPSSSRQCTSDGCGGRHHPLLHGSQRVFPRRPVPQSESSDNPIVGAALNAASTTTLLQVVPVRVHGSNGRYSDTHALLDAGAQTSLCTDQLRRRLGIDGERQQLQLNNVEGAGEKKTVHRFALQVSPLSGADSGTEVAVQEVFSVPRLNVQSQSVDWSRRQEWPHLADVDIPDTSNQPVELLLGANVTAAIVQREARVGRPGQPIAIRTAFGWCLSGSISQLTSPGAREVMHMTYADGRDDELNSMVKEWWSTESFGTQFDSKVATSAEDRRAEELLAQTTQWRGDRYETGLLWRSDDISLPNNYTAALRRLENTEKKLLRETAMAAAYQQTFKQYEDRGYARKLTPDELNTPEKREWFLPHHAVTNANKPGKIRVVFDAAASFKGTSLNNQLLTGPDLLQNIPGILMRFRKHRIGISADIEQMYHQVAAAKDDQPALRFLWRDLNTSRPPDVYQMDRIIFGARCSPASASYVLRKTAEDKVTDSCTDLAAADAVFNHFYMDDFLSSAPDLNSAVSSLRAVTDLVARGGFKLTKWLSNGRDVLASIPESERAAAAADLSTSLPTERVLGLLWDTELDQLKLQVQPRTVPPTKRGILRMAASIYDPLGFAAPFTLRARMIMQQLWLMKLNWDSELTGTVLEDWHQWTEELTSLEQLSIPRCYLKASSTAENRQMHVFCDASESAFGAVAYLRETSDDGKSAISFIMSKARVAPLKKMSIVRLETQAAVLAVRLAEAIKKEMKIEGVFFWSDSMVVLQYIANESRRFHTFIANRIAEIRQVSEPSQWRHVPGELNPADDCSRGLSVAQLISESRWLQGPAFLRESPESWPPDARLRGLDDADPEVRAVNLTCPETSAPLVLPDASRFSCWTRYKRSVAWLMRFLHNFVAEHGADDKRSWRRTGSLSVAELDEAESYIIRQSQLEHFRQEVTDLREDRPIGSKSDLVTLTPWLDEMGVLRVGGRLGNAPLADTARHPVILPRTSDVTRLLISHYHSRLLHAGPDHVLNQVRQRYWIPKGRATVRNILSACALCRRRRAQPQPPRMATLPKARFDSTYPFNSVGIDYFGPILTKVARKTEKRYCLLVTCLTTRAVHLELSTSLSTDSFLMAFQRFIARRGRPTTVYSDNGTSFRRGEVELRRLLTDLDQQHISDRLARDGIRWVFNPPTAGHMGGAWERMVASVKRALRVILGGLTVHEEALHTAITEVEAIINSRPLTHVSSDAGDFEALTPSHILLGRPACLLPAGLGDSTRVNARDHWRQARAIAAQFWRRWLREYVPALIQRSKWTSDTRNLCVGDLVLLAGDNTPRGLWPLARVVQVFPGPDGRVRSVEVATAAGRFRRPATKVCLLEEATCA